MSKEQLKQILSNLTLEFTYFQDEEDGCLWSHYNIDGTGYWVVKKNNFVYIYDYEKRKLSNDFYWDSVLALMQFDLNK